MPPDNAPVDTIICGDNVTIMQGWPDECIDLTVTSPPYDPTYYDKNGNLITDCKNGLRTYDGYEWDFVSVAGELWRVTKKGGVVVWVVGDATVNGSETGSSFRQALYFMELGFSLWDTMIYQTDKPPMNDRRYQACFEYMFVFSKGIPETFNPIMVKSIQANGKVSGTYRENDGMLKGRFHTRNVGETKIKLSIWYFAGLGENLGHPAIFPEALAHDHIISWSSENDTVLDPFIGSGTTAKVAAILNRRYIGIDCSSRYVELAKRRVGNVEREMRGEWKPLASTPGELDGLPMWEGME